MHELSALFSSQPNVSFWPVVARRDWQLQVDSVEKSAFESAAYGHSGLLDMIRTYDLLHLIQENGGHWTVGLAAKEEESAEHAAHA